MIALAKKILANDKILQSSAVQLEGFNYVIKNQLSFNKMIETQVAQLASSCLNHKTGKVPIQLEVNPKESVNVVTTRVGKSTQEPPYLQDAGIWQKAVTARILTPKTKCRRRPKNPTPLLPRKKNQGSPKSFLRVPRYNRLTVSGIEKEAGGRRTIRQVRRAN